MMNVFKFIKEKVIKCLSILKAKFNIVWKKIRIKLKIKTKEEIAEE
jgi:hypothetical protein